MGYAKKMLFLAFFAIFSLNNCSFAMQSGPSKKPAVQQQDLTTQAINLLKQNDLLTSGQQRFMSSRPFTIFQEQKNWLEQAQNLDLSKILGKSLKLGRTPTPTTQPDMGVIQRLQAYSSSSSSAPQSFAPFPGASAAPAPAPFTGASSSSSAAPDTGTSFSFGVFFNNVLNPRPYINHYKGTPGQGISIPVKNQFFQRDLAGQYTQNDILLFQEWDNQTATPEIYGKLSTKNFETIDPIISSSILSSIPMQRPSHAYDDRSIIFYKKNKFTKIEDYRLSVEGKYITFAALRPNNPSFQNEILGIISMHSPFTVGQGVKITKQQFDNEVYYNIIINHPEVTFWIIAGDFNADIPIFLDQISQVQNQPQPGSPNFGLIKIPNTQSTVRLSSGGLAIFDHMFYKYIGQNTLTAGAMNVYPQNPNLLIQHHAANTQPYQYHSDHTANWVSFTLTLNPQGASQAAYTQQTGGYPAGQQFPAPYYAAGYQAPVPPSGASSSTTGTYYVTIPNGSGLFCNADQTRFWDSSGNPYVYINGYFYLEQDTRFYWNVTSQRAEILPQYQQQQYAPLPAPAPIPESQYKGPEKKDSSAAELGLSLDVVRDRTFMPPPAEHFIPSAEHFIPPASMPPIGWMSTREAAYEANRLKREQEQEDEKLARALAQQDLEEHAPAHMPAPTPKSKPAAAPAPAPAPLSTIWVRSEEATEEKVLRDFVLKNNRSEFVTPSHQDRPLPKGLYFWSSTQKTTTNPGGDGEDLVSNNPGTFKYKFDSESGLYLSRDKQFKWDEKTQGSVHITKN